MRDLSCYLTYRDIGSGSLVLDVALRWMLYLEIICVFSDGMSGLDILSSLPAGRVMRINSVFYKL